MLYHPFTDWANLLSINSQVYGSYIAAFQACHHSYTHPQDFYTNPEAKCSDSGNKSDKDPKEQADKYLLANFKAFACQRPQEDFTQIDLLDSLSTWEID